MSLQAAKQKIKEQLANHFDAIEISSLTTMIIEHVTGWDQVNQIIHKEDSLSIAHNAAINIIVNQLQSGKPIQYLTQKAWFMGENYTVNEAVLIPRPETEELVEWVIDYATIKNKSLSILDIGTGSGCIAIALQKALSNCSVDAMDISEEAIGIAKINAAALATKIEWMQEDILQTTYLPKKYDIIVSNPPYIPLYEKNNIQIQVKNYEPSIALFVPDEDPLLFYRCIARLGKQYLNPNGQLFFEIHYDQGNALLSLFDEMGYHAEIKQDMFGKDRMLRASKK